MGEYELWVNMNYWIYHKHDGEEENRSRAGQARFLIGYTFGSEVPVMIFLYIFFPLAVW